MTGLTLFVVFKEQNIRDIMRNNSTKGFSAVD